MNVNTVNPLPIAKGEGGGGGLDKKRAELKKATSQFESFFLHQMLQEMRKSIPKDTLIGDDGHQQEIFQDMMDQTLADSASKRGDFGLGKMMYDQLSKTLDATPDTGLDVRR